MNFTQCEPLRINQLAKLLFQLRAQSNCSKSTAFSFRAQHKARHGGLLIMNISAVVLGLVSAQIYVSFLRRPQEPLCCTPKGHLKRSQHEPWFLSQGWSTDPETANDCLAPSTERKRLRSEALITALFFPPYLKNPEHIYESWSLNKKSTQMPKFRHEENGTSSGAWAEHERTGPGPTGQAQVPCLDQWVGVPPRLPGLSCSAFPDHGTCHPRLGQILHPRKWQALF